MQITKFNLTLSIIRVNNNASVYIQITFLRNFKCVTSNSIFIYIYK